jgi:2-amino-4-hydroxy-6-hydroxymethyldihydropteridine diphosphokinase
MSLKPVLIGVGSNRDPEHHILQALDLLMDEVQVVGTSAFYETEPVKRGEQPNFFNGVWAIETDLAPRRLKFGVLRKIEEKLGRVRTGDKYAERPIDLDILLYADEVIREPDLQIPDPDLYRRFFVAVPAAEVDPGRMAPDTGRTLSSIASDFLEIKLVPAPQLTEKLKERIHRHYE